MARVRITRPVIEEMSGTSIWGPEGHLEYSKSPDLQEDARRLVEKLKTPSSRKDRSVEVELGLTEARVLYDYMEVWSIGAEDNVSLAYGDDKVYWMTQIRSSRAMMRKLGTAFGYDVKVWDTEA